LRNWTACCPIPSSSTCGNPPPGRRDELHMGTRPLDAQQLAVVGRVPITATLGGVRRDAPRPHVGRYYGDVRRLFEREAVDEQAIRAAFARDTTREQGATRPDSLAAADKRGSPVRRAKRSKRKEYTEEYRRFLRRRRIDDFHECRLRHMGYQGRLNAALDAQCFTVN
jgi:hypothetical protein